MHTPRRSLTCQFEIYWVLERQNFQKGFAFFSGRIGCWLLTKEETETASTEQKEEEQATKNDERYGDCDIDEIELC